MSEALSSTAAATTFPLVVLLTPKATQALTQLKMTLLPTTGKRNAPLALVAICLRMCRCSPDRQDGMMTCSRRWRTFSDLYSAPAFFSGMVQWSTANLRLRNIGKIGASRILAGGPSKQGRSTRPLRAVPFCSAEVGGVESYKLATPR